MYSDPSLIRDQILKVRLNEREDALLDALTEYTGQQKSTLMREMILEQARLVLAGVVDYAPGRGFNEEPLAVPQMAALGKR